MRREDERTAPPTRRAIIIEEQRWLGLEMGIATQEARRERPWNSPRTIPKCAGPCAGGGIRSTCIAPARTRRKPKSARRPAGISVQCGSGFVCSDGQPTRGRPRTRAHSRATRGGRCRPPTRLSCLGLPIDSDFDRPPRFIYNSVSCSIPTSLPLSSPPPPPACLQSLRRRPMRASRKFLTTRNKMWTLPVGPRRSLSPNASPEGRP